MNLGAENNRFDTGYFKDLDVENGIMGGGGVKQTTLYSGNSQITSLYDTFTYSLLDSIDNYDYFVINFTGIVGQNDNKYTSNIIPAPQIPANYQYSFSYNHDNANYQFGGWFVLGTISGNTNTSNKTITVGLRYKGSSFSAVYLDSVVGIKCIDTDIKNVTSLDETLLYSGNDLVVVDNPPSIRVNYTLSDNYNNYDYIIIEVVAPSAISSAVNYCTITVKMPLDSTLHHPIFSASMYNPTVNTKYDFNGFVEFNNDNIIVFAPRFMGSDVSGVILSKVIGIKKNSLSTAGIAEMAMPSDVYTTLTADSNGNVVAPANGYLQVIYDIVTNNISSVGLDDYVALIPAGFNGSTDCGTELYAVSKGKTTKLNIASALSGHYTVKFIYSIGSAKALGLI